MFELQSNLLPVGIGIGIALLILVFLFRPRKNKSPQHIERVRPRGPANIRYACAKCAGQFTHTNRTISAWEKGSRRLFCNTCHKGWRSENPPTANTASKPAHRPVHSSMPAPKTFNTSTASSRPPAGSGCLGIALLLVLVPSAVVYAAFLA